MFDQAEGSVAAAIVRDLAACGLTPAEPEAFGPAQALAERLIGGRIVSAEDLRKVHERSGAGLFLAREDGVLTGVLAFVLLNAPGVAAVLADTFDAVAPSLDHVAGPTEEVRGLYGWGVAAATKTSAQRLLDGAGRMGRGAVAHLPYYARPTTAAGERLMRERLGFVDLPGSRTGLVWAPPANTRVAA